MQEALLLLLFLIGLALIIRMGEYHTVLVKIMLIISWTLSYSGGVAKLYSQIII